MWGRVVFLYILTITRISADVTDPDLDTDGNGILSDSETSLNRNFRLWPGRERQCNVFGVTGVCKSALSCKRSGGRVSGRGSCGIQQCCVYSGFCGSVSTQKVSYFRSPTSHYPNECSFTVRARNRQVCQMRLDFEEFQLTNPTRDETTTNPWQCRTDSLEIETPNKFKTPVLCGYNKDQHMYIPVNAQNNEMSINLIVNLADRGITGAISDPKWKIRITQLECPVNHKQVAPSQLNLYRDFWQLAPPGCLQYFTDRFGTVRSFGYNPALNPTENHYTGGLNYGICFKRTPSTCGMRFTGLEFQLAGPCGGTVTAPGDYLYIPEGVYTTNGVSMLQDRYCNDELDPVTNPQSQVQSVIPTSLYIRFYTDDTTAVSSTTENGFMLRYEVPPVDKCL